MDDKDILYNSRRLKEGSIYWDKEHNEFVEFGYMGKTGLAIVYAPGDSGGGMQSAWALDPNNLETMIHNCITLQEPTLK